MEHEESLQRLIMWFRKRVEGRVVVAFSGGVDSTLVAVAAHEALKDSALAITVETEFMTKGEVRGAISVAKGLGIRHRVIRLSLPEEIRANPPDRCYRCKRLIMRELKAYAKRHGNSLVVDGTNFDDLHSQRPGLRALREEAIASPLAELSLGKGDVRGILRRLGFDYGKPSSPCLATRFPTGHTIRRGELEAVAEAEEYIRGMGFSQVRVRVRGGMAKIEVKEGELERMMESGRYGLVASRLKGLGFKEVVLDLEGYVPEGEGGRDPPVEK
jgi:uncharacterized protein